MKLIIKNFQAQRYLEIDIADTITTIIGDSDVGKSSTIRAINWLFTNEAPCRDFITWGETECSVTLEDIDGHTITRLRNDKKKRNIYILDDKEFACLRQTVPAEIATIFKVVEDNFQFQHDLPFWFSNTGGELAKKLNKIINLDIVDFTFSELNSEIKKIKSTKTVYEERIEARKKSKEIFSNLESFKVSVDRVQLLNQKLINLNEQRDDLTVKIADIQNLNKKIQAFDGLSAAFESALEIFNRYSKKKKLKYDLEQIVNQIKSINVHDLADILNQINEIQLLRQAVKKREKLIIELQDLVKRIYTYDQKQKETDQKISALKKNIDEALKTRCPYCGRSSNHSDGCYVEYSVDEIIGDVQNAETLNDFNK